MNHIRYKLQKILLDSARPKEVEIAYVDACFGVLEGLPDLEDGVINDTKIRRVLRAISKLDDKALNESKYKFKQRSLDLLDGRLASQQQPATDKRRRRVQQGSKNGKRSKGELSAD